MGFHRAVLTAVAWFLLVPATAAFAGKVSCLHCHTPHYQPNGGCVGCHRGDDRTDRVRIAHTNLIPARFAHFTLGNSPPVKRGKKLQQLFACRRCHTVAGKGNRLAADLDRFAVSAAPQEIFDAMKSPVLFMPSFRFDDRQMTDLVNAILAGGGKAGRKGRDAPQAVHFEDGGKNGENAFVKQCGACHRALTERLGGVGRGEIGPNLSGLFTEFYPGRYRGEERWSAQNLKKWLGNPRKARQNARMQPVRLKADEFEWLVDILKVAPSPPLPLVSDDFPTS